MKVVLLSTFGPEVRGISYYSDNLLNALRATGKLEVIAQDYDKIYPDWLYPAQTDGVAPAHNRRVHYARPGTWRIEDPSPDIVHVQYWTFGMALILRKILARAQAEGIPSVITLHNPVAHERGRLLRGAEHRCLELADRIVIHDDCGLDAIPAILHSKVRVIPHGTEFIDISDEALRLAVEQPPYLLYFGNIRPYKGVEQMLAAWREISAEFPDLRLIIAGRLWEGSTLLSRLAAGMLGTARQAKLLRRQAQDPSLERVEFRFEFIPDSDLDSLIRNARYVVFPYQKFSGHSGALARAASQGTPVLVTNVGGLPALAINSEYVCDAGGQAALTQLLRRHLASREDRLAERKAQLNKARSLSWAHAADEHVKLYESIGN